MDTSGVVLAMHSLFLTLNAFVIIDLGKYLNVR
jgi:hypothetical protein